MATSSISRRSLLPREGFIADSILGLLGSTIFNPVLLVPLHLALQYTNVGRIWTERYPSLVSRLVVLCGVSAGCWLSRWVSDRVVNNWTSDTFDWKQEIVVITGGSNGIGALIVQDLAARKIKVAVLDIRPLTFEAGPGVKFYQCDITNDQELAEAARRVRHDFGDPTVLINNAGTVVGKSILDSTSAENHRTFAVNVLAQFSTVREFLPSMAARNHGMVVTVASVAGYASLPRMTDYSASKAASIALHEGLCAELRSHYNAPRVRTLLVTPGHVRTELFNGFNQGRPFLLPSLKPETVAETVVERMLSGRSGHIVLPRTMGILPMMRALPAWVGKLVRLDGTHFMKDFVGREKA